jgi:Major Facilitator Superfamily
MLSPYRRVLSIPGALLFSATGLVARLPISMVSLGIVLLVSTQTGSYGLAGSVAAVFVLANALLAIVHGRMVDNYGQPRVLPPVISIFGLGLALLTFGVLEAWPTWSIYLTAAVTGAALPQVGACVRARWSYVLQDPTTVQTAYAVEGVADEVVFIAGPVLVTVLATTVHPAAGLATALVAGVGGTLAFAALRSTAPPAHRHGEAGEIRPPMPWRVVGVVAVVYFALGALFGAAEVATVAFAEEQDATRYAGVLLGLWSLGSLLSGVAVGAITWRSGPVNRVRWGTIGLVVTLVPISFIDSVAMMAGFLFIAGLAISPTLIGSMSLIEAAVPEQRLSEGLAVVQTGISAGLAPGAAIAGIVIDTYGASPAYYVPLVAAVVAVMAAWLTNLPRQ